MEPTNIFTDGASRGNPGKAAWAFTAPDCNITLSGLLPGDARTNNEAEYTAIVRALLWAHESGYTSIVIHSDSQTVVNQLSDQCRTKDPKLVELKKAVMDYTSSLQLSVKYVHVPREHPHILTADVRCNWELDHAKVMDDKQKTLNVDRPAADPETLTLLAQASETAERNAAPDNAGKVLERRRALLAGEI